ncbi:cation:proton antiporter [Lacisediminihabitans changchengi]|uniref:Cation:proton antiporter n=1 Tax=Lacisediminihabitans changchengi TaxID=2787634 RepID=A0A934SND6_9MICO|nr:cation:proton antiporter [Lacisediminihabitans changchengi]MBK4348192.1 cation:proton antiporter [Lacisediminihabitans changchengi]
MESTELVTLVVVAVVLVIGVVSFFAGRIGVAAPLALTVVGVVVGAIPAIPHFEIEPSIVLTVVLPPLLYAAARKVPFVDFRRNLRVIGFLAIVLVVVSAVLVGVLVHLLWATVPLALAIALGAVVAPPDAVAATSLGKRLGLPPRIVTILEGEGLVNDATALVLLSTMLAIVTTSVQSPSGWMIALTFLWAVVGAVLIGGILGVVAVTLRSRVTDPVLDAAISLVIPFVAYLAGEFAHSSGVVAVVVAGIVVGNQGAYRIRASFRLAESGTWRIVTLLIENAVFLFMGFQLWPIVATVARGDELLSTLGVAGLVIVLLVGIRFAAMPPLLWTIRRRYRTRAARADETKGRFDNVTEEDFQRRAANFRQLGITQSPAHSAIRGLRARFGIVTTRDRAARDRIAAQLAELEKNPQPVVEVDETTRARFSRTFQNFRKRLDQQNNDLTAERDQALGWRDGVILGLSGMRGVVTVAAVQTIPEVQPMRESLVLVAFAVAIITLVVQGLLLPPVVRRLRPAADSTSGERTEVYELRKLMKDAGDVAVSAAVAEAEASGVPVRPQVLDEVNAAGDAWIGRLEIWAKADLTDPANEVAQYQQLRRVLLAAERDALRDAYERGAFSSEAIDRLRATLDADEISIDSVDSDAAGR